SGLWRELPVFTQWGVLESVRQPGETHASEAARTMKASIGSLSPRSARHPQQRTAPPYAQGSGGASDEPLTPTPNSARAYYQGAM
ncbi:unnamed protein product, partial [Polarella glacialis]